MLREKRPLLLLIVWCLSAPAASPSPGSAAQWQTLSGSEPVVVAKGGLSGLFPDSSDVAYLMANATSLQGVVSWCDVQLSKDGVGVCLPDLNMANCTEVARIPSFAARNATYTVNGRQVEGFFTADFTSDELFGIRLTQALYSRPDNFDSAFPIQTVEQVSSTAQSLWLNIEHDLFYKEHRLNMAGYVSSISRNLSIAYISSPEIGFLKSIAAAAKAVPPTTLVFRFLAQDAVEPTTNQTYGSLLKDLKFVSSFASAIVVPKDYIWPVTPQRVLEPYTSVVADAHKANLKVFASGFANDFLTAYNYSYDPVAEYLSFIDNGVFAVDGLVSDFPVTASEAVACFSHLGTNGTETGKPLIISNNGDSGDFPGCTDLAYRGAVDGGADVIDCSVQVTKDGNLVCLSSIDLMRSTSVAKSNFGTSLSTFPDIQPMPGVFAFNLTWDEINALKPVISSPMLNYTVVRNPANQNAGRFMSLKDFLVFAKDKPLKGVLLRLENARFFVEKLGFDVVAAVIAAVSDAGYTATGGPQVMVMSSSSSTLIPFREKTAYKIVYMVKELVGDVDPSALKLLGTFAHGVAVKKEVVFPVTELFLSNQTQVVQKLHSANLSAYAYGLMNEFLSIPWDFFSDPFVEIKNLADAPATSVDGVITDFPATARLYRRNACSRANYEIPLVQPHGLLDAISTINGTMPPELPPYPTLTKEAVAEAPLTASALPPSSPKATGGQPHLMPSLLLAAALFLCSLSLVL